MKLLARLSILSLALFGAVAMGHAEELPLTFSGGHDTDPRDHGRPVVLVAGGLGVTPEVFREAFSGVTPSRNGPPSGAQARKNKEALLKVLGPHGITNERLDEVSDYYRYRRERGEMWPTKPAKGHAVVENGQIKQIVITDGGSGYSSPPTVTVTGLKSAKLTAELSFGKDLKKNGAISAVKVAPEASR